MTIFLTYNLLSIASFRIVPLILFFSIINFHENCLPDLSRLPIEGWIHSEQKVKISFGNCWRFRPHPNTSRPNRFWSQCYNCPLRFLDLATSMQQVFF